MLCAFKSDEIVGMEMEDEGSPYPKVYRRDFLETTAGKLARLVCVQTGTPERP